MEGGCSVVKLSEGRHGGADDITLLVMLMYSTAALMAVETMFGTRYRCF